MEEVKTTQGGELGRAREGKESRGGCVPKSVIYSKLCKALLNCYFTAPHTCTVTETQRPIYTNIHVYVCADIFAHSQ